MQIDEARWRALLDTYRDAVDEGGPTLLQIQQSQSAVAQAQGDLDRYRARGATGQANTRSVPEDITADFARGVAELEGRVMACRREADRIATRSKTCADRRNELARLVAGIREWATAQSPPITLPGDDDGMQMTGFAASSVHIPTPPPTGSWP